MQSYITLKECKFLRGSFPVGIIVRKNVHQKNLYITFYNLSLPDMSYIVWRNKQ